MRGGQGRTEDEVAEAAAICLWCGLGVLAMVAFAGLWRGLGL